MPTRAEPERHCHVDQANAVAHRLLVCQQVAQQHASQHLVDALLEEHPDRTNAAVSTFRAALFVDGVTHTVQVEGGQFGRLQHVLDRDFTRGPGERVPALRTTRALHDVCPTQTQHDLLDVVCRKLLTFGDFTSGNGSIHRTARQVERADEPVFCPSSYTHGHESMTAWDRPQAKNP